MSRNFFSKTVIRSSALIGTWLGFCLLVAPGRTAAATPTHTMTDSVRTALTNRTHPRIAKLAKHDISLGPILVAERLPQRGASSRQFLVEFEASHRNHRFRYPVALEQETTDDDGVQWAIRWAPRGVYVRTLTEVISDDLPAPSNATSATAWTDQARTPAFPVIVTPSLTVTPFGPVDTNAGGRVSNSLSRHATRWLNGAMRGDDAAGSTDLIVAADATWKSVHTAIFQLAANGIFRLHFVVAQAKTSTNDIRPAVLEALAPVKLPRVESTADTGLPKLRIGFDALDDRDGFSMTLKGAHLSGDSTSSSAGSVTECPPTSQLCATSPESVAGRLDGLQALDDTQGWPPSLGIVAFHHAMSTQRVLELLAVIGGSTGVPSDRWMLTRFGKRPDPPENKSSQ